ncbi:hypothetical protein Nepgr_033803 [Nepenthes gracilis]|uniref:Uncharacterized protein n=1 Tax=Nepenthes gracilis TaxID=150966 RepID=A0AAD3TMG5_NEPGR|nr:hypothetical protein Nepgr_033803 [Nepenthes gracilis]
MNDLPQTTGTCLKAQHWGAPLGALQSRSQPDAPSEPLLRLAGAPKASKAAGAKQEPAGMSHVRCPLMSVSLAMDGRPSDKPPSQQKSSKAAKHVIALRVSHHSLPCHGGSIC